MESLGLVGRVYNDSFSLCFAYFLGGSRMFPFCTTGKRNLHGDHFMRSITPKLRGKCAKEIVVASREKERDPYSWMNFP